MNNIKIIKNSNKIIIFNKGSKLIIKDKDYDKLKNKTKKEILKWYKSR